LSRIRVFVTAPTPFGAWGDVCLETAMIGTPASVSAGIAGVQDGPKAFAAEPWEVPT
jgi:hypothetical protein